MGVVVVGVFREGDSTLLVDNEVLSGGKRGFDILGSGSESSDAASFCSSALERYRMADTMLSVPTVPTVEGVPGDGSLVALFHDECSDGASGVSGFSSAKDSNVTSSDSIVPHALGVLCSSSHCLATGTPLDKWFR